MRSKSAALFSEQQRVVFRIRCAELGLSQAEVARRLGIPAPTFSKYVSGSIPLRTGLLERIGKVIRVELGGVR